MTSIRAIAPMIGDHLNKNPPEWLHHYTTQQGLIGMVDTKVLWATHVLYLSDKVEFTYAVCVADAIVATKIDKESDEGRKIELGHLRSAIQRAGINVCVASWSASNDDLSQWRAYGGDSGGFALSATGPAIQALAKRENFLLAQCVYDPVEQRTLIDRLIEGTLAENIEAKRNGTFDDPPAGDMTYRINRYAALFKHAKFSQEQEWRLISVPLNRQETRYKIRAGRSNPIPYCEVSLLDEKGRFCIDHAIVGPCREPELARKAVDDLLGKALGRGSGPYVTVTKVPYRNW